MTVRKPARQRPVEAVRPSVPRLWPDSTIAILASGPSLTLEDAACVRGKAKVIAINASYQMAPWADVLYAADENPWRWYRGAREFAGLKYSLTASAAKYGVTVLQCAEGGGLSLDPTRLHAGPSGGRNSGYQAINLAVLFGASRIVLLGYDMQAGPNGQQHCHDDHPSKSTPNYDAWRRGIDALAEPLRLSGVSVVNCTRRTALTGFPQMSIEQALAACEVAA